MKRLFLLALLLNLAGCATFKEMQSTVVHRYDAGRQLSAARTELEQGKSTTATVHFEEIVAAPGVKGITDEALFRLSVLRITDEEEDGSRPAIRYLERLRQEYADSVWTQQSKPLLEHLTAVVDIKKQIRNLKIINLSLTKENKELQQHKMLNNSLSKENRELHQSIERLKDLDIQLERKAR